MRFRIYIKNGESIWLRDERSSKFACARNSDAVCKIMHCMSDAYLAEVLLEEYQGKDDGIER